MSNYEEQVEENAVGKKKYRKLNIEDAQEYGIE